MRVIWTIQQFVNIISNTIIDNVWRTNNLLILFCELLKEDLCLFICKGSHCGFENGKRVNKWKEYFLGKTGKRGERRRIAIIGRKELFWGEESRIEDDLILFIFLVIFLIESWLFKFLEKVLFSLFLIGLFLFACMIYIHHIVHSL